MSQVIINLQKIMSYRRLSHQTYEFVYQSFPNNYFNIKSQYQALYAIYSFLYSIIFIGVIIHPTKFSKLVGPFCNLCNSPSPFSSLLVQQSPKFSNRINLLYVSSALLAYFLPGYHQILCKL